MGHNYFLYIQIAVVGLVILYLILPRKDQGPRLKMGAWKKGGGSIAPFFKSREKNLNVIFAYNAHNFDAHEVLGLPAGSSLEDSRAAYKRVITTVDAKSKPFIDAAMQAIEKSHKQS